MDNQPTQSTPPPPSSANSSKTFLLIIGTITLMAISAVGGYFIGSNKQPQPSQPSQSLPTATSTPTPMSNETTNWKTYTDTKHGYSFKYPAIFFVSDSIDPTGDIHTTTISNYESNHFASGKIDPDDPNVFLMWIVNPPQDTDLTKVMGFYKLRKLENYSVDGVEGFKSGNTEIIVVHNRKEYAFHTRQANSRYFSYFTQILSTFKFLN